MNSIKEGEPRGPALPNSWPSELSARIAIAIRGHVENGNVGLAASDAAQIAAYYYTRHERTVNAQLRAAAPDLLAALKLAEERLHMA